MGDARVQHAGQAHAKSVAREWHLHTEIMVVVPGQPEYKDVNVQY